MTEFKDSGGRRDFGTGAVRDKAGNKGRFDLLPYLGIREVARVYEIGAKKYQERNWEGGIPVSTYLDSAARHLSKAASGLTDEPHLPMAAWNILCAIATSIWAFQGDRPKHLLYDMPIKLCDMLIPGREDEQEEPAPGKYDPFEKWVNYLYDHDQGPVGPDSIKSWMDDADKVAKALDKALPGFEKPLQRPGWGSRDCRSDC